MQARPNTSDLTASNSPSGLLSSVGRFIVRLIRIFSVYAVPGVVLLTAFGSLLLWHSPSPAEGANLHTLYMLEGAMLALALILILFAFISRRWLYVLFGAWLIGNLRVTALSLGWDMYWAGFVIPPDLLPLSRQLTSAVYYVLSWALFDELFTKDLTATKYRRLRQVGLGLGMLMLVAAVVLPYEHYVPVMWLLAVLGMGIVLYLVARLVTRRNYSAGLLLAAGLGLIILVATGVFSLFAPDAGSSTLSVSGVHAVAALLSGALVAVVIAQHGRSERRQRLSVQAELQRVYDVTPIGLFSLNLDGMFTRTNNAFRNMLWAHVPPSEQTDWANCFGHSSWQELSQRVQAETDVEIEIEQSGADHAARRSFLVRAAMRGDFIEGSLQDITERTDTIEKLRMLANHDPLTNTLNRRGVQEHLETALAALDRGEPLALAYLDLGSLKIVNELYGYTMGDDMLKEVCDRAAQLLAPHHPIGRLSGAEFLLLFPNTSLEEARRLSNKVLRELQGMPCKIGGRTLQLRACMGLVEIVDPQIDPQDAILFAGRACRAAKDNSANDLVVYESSASMLQEQSRELRLLRDFSRGFSPERMFLLMQPVMSMKDPMGPLSVEVLLRMRDVDDSVIPSGKVIAAAEESGIMPSLDHWVISTALQWLEDNQLHLPHLRTLAVNVNGMSLNDPHFIGNLFDTLERHTAILPKLCIEITESVALRHIANTRQFILRLQQWGVKVALDDFGAGYTSFSYLKQLPANAVKIDGAFIQNMTHHAADVAIVEAIVALARNMGMETIAEWVEDTDTLNALAHIGVDAVQGYIVAAPMAPERIIRGSNIADFIKDEAARALVTKAFGKRKAAAAI